MTQFNSIVGQAKEMVGSGIEQAYAAVGGSKEPSSFSTSGKEQHAQGMCAAPVSTRGSLAHLLQARLRLKRPKQRATPRAFLIE